MSDNMQSAIQQFAAEISSLQSQVSSLENEVRFTQVQGEISTLDNSVGHLSQQIQELRSRGYAFEKDLESRIADFQQRWSIQRGLAQQQTLIQSSLLQASMMQAENLVSQLSLQANAPYGAQALLAQAKSTVDSLQSKANAAQDSVRAIFHPFEQEITPFITHLNEVDWALTQLSQATFQLHPTESTLMAVKATFIKGSKEAKEDPQGVLYVTDERLIFEQKQEIATKKVLFITTEKQKVQQLLLEVPLAMMDKAQGSKQGLFGHEDHLQITFTGGAMVNQAHFHIDGQDATAWQTLLNRVKAHEFDPGRVVPLDQNEVEKVKSVPTQCPACGGTITQPVLRGMDSITCEFCGHVIRL